MELAVIDRIVEGEAILLVGAAQREHMVAAAQLPPTARTGTWLRVRFVGDTLVEAKVDGEETRRAEQRIRGKLSRLRLRGRRPGPPPEERCDDL